MEEKDNKTKDKDKTREGKKRGGKTTQCSTRQHKAWQDKTNTKEHKTRQDIL